MPSGGLPGVGSFDDWSRWVRDVVHWLTDHDLADAFKQNKAEDPTGRTMLPCLVPLHSMYGTSAFTSSDFFSAYSDVYAVRASSGPIPSMTSPLSQPLFSRLLWCRYRPCSVAPPTHSTGGGSRTRSGAPRAWCRRTYERLLERDQRLPAVFDKVAGGYPVSSHDPEPNDWYLLGCWVRIWVRRSWDSVSFF